MTDTANPFAHLVPREVLLHEVVPRCDMRTVARLEQTSRAMFKWVWSGVRELTPLPAQATDAAVLRCALSLEVLDLNFNNKITGPAIVACPRLRVLSLGRNPHITSYSLCQLTHLDTLYIGSSSSLTDAVLQQIGPHLRALDIGAGFSEITLIGLKACSGLRALAPGSRHSDWYPHELTLHFPALEWLVTGCTCSNWLAAGLLTSLKVFHARFVEATNEETERAAFHELYPNATYCQCQGNPACTIRTQSLFLPRYSDV